VRALDATSLRDHFGHAYSAGNLVIAAAGHVDHAAVLDLVSSAFADLPSSVEQPPDIAPSTTPGLLVRDKALEQCHVVLGVTGYPQSHVDRYICYVMNIVLGGTMSSRLFQNIREKRGLAYAVSSGFVSYQDGGALTIYAGCDAESVVEVVDLIVAELQQLRDEPITSAELTRAKDHLKGSLVLGLESTSSRMSQLARQEMYYGRQFTLDDTLQAVQAVTLDDVHRVARALLVPGAVAATILGPVDGLPLREEQLALT